MSGQGLRLSRRAAILSLLSAPAAARRVSAQLESGDSSRGWAPLFNGTDLSGWDTYLGKPHRASVVPDVPKNDTGDYLEAVGFNRDPNRVFSVVTLGGSPAIRISGETYGALVTTREYENYHLRFEFRWGEKRWPPREEALRDTGCCYHSVGPLGASYGFWQRSFEFQIMEGDCGDFYSLAGVIVDAEAVARSPADPKSDLSFVRGAPRVTGITRRIVKSADGERPAGQWNTLELHCLGQTSVHVVNGIANVVLGGLRHLVDGREAPLVKGKLQFQSEGAEVFYRNIALRPITAIPEALLTGR